MESTSSPSGSQQTETDTPSTLLSLPTEVLSRVVALCALQDAAYRERLLAAKHKELEISQLLKGVGMSLQSLSLVNKQLHALCCAQLFKTLRSSKAMMPMFRFYIWAAHSQSFSEVIFDDVAIEEALAYTLSTATAFPKLRSLSVHRSAAMSLLGRNLTATEIKAEDEEASARVSTFCRLAARVSRAALLGPFRGWEAATMLQSFTNLTSLELAIHSASQGKDGGLTTALASLTKLRRLALDATRPGGQLNPTWSETTWGFEDSLRSLTPKVGVLDAESWCFARRFASSLHELRLEFADTSIIHHVWADWASNMLACEALNLPWSSASAHKTLQSLHLRCPAPAALAILAGLLSRGDSKLQHLSLSLKNLPEIEIQTDSQLHSPIFPLLLLAPSLSHLSVSPLSAHGRLSSVSTLALRAFRDTRGIVLESTAGVWDPFLRVGRGSEGVLRSAFTERRCDVAREVLEWAMRYNERLRSTVDAEGVEELLWLLEKLKARKMLEED